MLSAPFGLNGWAKKSFNFKMRFQRVRNERSNTFAWYNRAQCSSFACERSLKAPCTSAKEAFSVLEASARAERALHAKFHCRCDSDGDEIRIVQIDPLLMPRWTLLRNINRDRAHQVNIITCQISEAKSHETRNLSCIRSNASKLKTATPQAQKSAMNVQVAVRSGLFAIVVVVLLCATFLWIARHKKFPLNGRPLSLTMLLIFGVVCLDATSLLITLYNSTYSAQHFSLSLNLFQFAYLVLQVGRSDGCHHSFVPSLPSRHSFVDSLLQLRYNEIETCQPQVRLLTPCWCHRYAFLTFSDTGALSYESSRTPSDTFSRESRDSRDSVELPPAQDAIQHSFILTHKALGSVKMWAIIASVYALICSGIPMLYIIFSPDNQSLFNRSCNNIYISGWVVLQSIAFFVAIITLSVKLRRAKDGFGIISEFKQNGAQSHIRVFLTPLQLLISLSLLLSM
jgi:hypothetical protein